MPVSGATDRLLARLEEAKRRFGPGEDIRVGKLLDSLARRSLPDAGSLIRFHESLLFVRAHPQSVGVLRRAEELLASFAQRVETARSKGEDLSALEESEVSGIAGETFSGMLSYPIALCLSRLHPRDVDIDWENYDITDRLAALWRRLFPLLEEDSSVEAHVPYLDWLRAAMGTKGPALPWLLSRVERLPMPTKERAELFDLLELPLRWEFGNGRSTRTRLRFRAGPVFCHQGELIKRSQISLAAELASPPLRLKKLDLAHGSRFLDIARETSAMRYRELYGFTYGDPRYVYETDAGRGVRIFLAGVPPERRLPLRAYHAAMMFKNGVPVGYFETLSFFERMEVGFNLYYTFREGETAWLFARLLRLFRQVLGVTCFSIDPYQIGMENEEAIESGAFWFYKKLGFRPVLPEIAALAEAEERKIRVRAGYRTTARTLRRMAAGHMIYEMPGTGVGDWDRFQVRNLGLAVQRRMGKWCEGDAVRFGKASAAAVGRALGKIPNEPNFENLASVLSLIPGLARWTPEEKDGVVRAIRAKDAPEEALYVRLLGRHRKLREAVIRLGS